MKNFELDAEAVTVVDIRCSMDDRNKVMAWVYDTMNGRFTRTGPEIKDLRTTGRFHGIAHIPGKFEQADLQGRIAAL